jgi:hypothetical protein
MAGSPLPMSQLDIDGLNLPLPEIPDDNVPSAWLSTRADSSPSRLDRHHEVTYPFKLPILQSSRGKIPFISASVLAGIISDPTANPFKHTFIIDARSPREYAGGHIQGSYNAESLRELLNFLTLFWTCEDIGIVIHCEFTSRRAPMLAQEFRNYDRQIALRDRCPIAFPETYLLEGGYSTFYAQFPGLCQGKYLMEETCATKRPRSYSLECSSQLLIPPLRNASANSDPFKRMTAIRLQSGRRASQVNTKPE